MNNSVSNEENKVEEKVSQPEVVISPLGFRNLNPTASIQEPNPEVTNDDAIKPESSKKGPKMYKGLELKQINITAVVGVILVYAAAYIIFFDFILGKRDLGIAPSSQSLTMEEQYALGRLVPNVSNSLDYEGAYGTELKTATNVEPAVLLNYALNEAKKTASNMTQPDSAEYRNFKNRYCANGVNSCFAISQQAIVDILNRDFGTHEYQMVEFKIGNNANDTCTIANDSFMCHEAVNKPADTIRKVGQIILAKTDEQNIYLYEQTVFVSGYSVSQTEAGYNHHLGKVYKYNKDTNGHVLAENVDVVSPTEVADEEIINQYREQAQNYKHTFVKNESGNYYWYSTEPVISTES